ncbi:aspartic proteinase-like protein 1 [Panicum miliaceum]|uniref:Aspartic proteinase-like protein 1 n=1 Tax=Panicum miliaceum TaxID=4540 RepID=A0A3L6RYC1_PANMI|nr:aspartic proteinase-like protein 1 [Panicum miliaceum]
MDTGSDLFWVPCDCKQCAPLSNNATAGGGPQLREYSPRLSSTSAPVTCDSPLCDRPNACSAATNGSCPYGVRYVSANTSSSGVLVQDEGSGPGAAAEPLQAPVVFGCGKLQTGAFLDGAGFDGLLGLGMDRVSVPSVLASRGLVASNSFSMCFSDDGVGRINFGDAGSRSQAETPFIPRSTHPTYNVSFTTINVGSESAPVEFAAIMDSGTSFTYLNDPEYTALATNFNSQIRERRANFSSGSAGRFPFEYCYRLSPEQTEVELPVGQRPCHRLLPGHPQERHRINIVGRKLSLLRCSSISSSVNSELTLIDLIGVDAENFMTGLKVVFDRERSVLGWQKFDCYKNTRVADGPGGSPSPAPAPTTTLTPRQNDASNRYPGAAPVPRPLSAGSRHAAGALPLLLPLLLVAAALV